MSFKDRFRPQVHFTPEANWMNDPNGCIVHNGTYHLFYQYHPGSTEWGPMHWGHATSSDLLHWQHQPIALTPDATLGAAFSGSAIQDRINVSELFDDLQGLLVFYTTHLDSGAQRHALQQQCMAYSKDQGQTWQPYAGNPIVKNPGIKDFRDPKVFFHAQTEHWIMVVVAGQQVNFYRSRNLLNWEYCGEFSKFQGHDEVVWECPDLLAMQDDQGNSHWVLFVSGVTPEHKPFPPMQYFIGHFDGLTFTESEPSETINIVDVGADFYAAQSFHGCLEHDGRHIWIAWCNYWPYAKATPADLWRGMMSLPRELSLVTHNGRPTLCQQVVREFNAQLSATKCYNSAGDWTIDNPDSALRFQLSIAEAATQAVRLAFKNDDGDTLTIQWQPETKMLTLDRTGVASSAFHQLFNQQQTVDFNDHWGTTQPLDIVAIIDRCSIELFALGGRIVMSNQVFPESPFNRVVLEATGAVTLNQAHVECS